MKRQHFYSNVMTYNLYNNKQSWTDLTSEVDVLFIANPSCPCESTTSDGLYLFTDEGLGCLIRLEDAEPL